MNCSDDNRGKKFINNVGLNNYKFIKLYLQNNFNNYKNNLK